jgi:cytochrome d ubiquinol oxidase subunit II
VIADVIAVVALVALAVYSVSGGADFGAGLWSLIASGRRADDQRDLVDEAIAPIWEANHVWLILVVVLLFVCFPVAYSTASIALHIPLTLMLIGVVLRGSAFAFRHYAQTDTLRRRWGRVFAMTSVLTPIFLGLVLGAICSGRIAAVTPRDFHEGYVATWLTPFPLAVGAFTLALFALCAAVYLTNETQDRELQDVFRFRAIVAAIVTGAIGLGVIAVGLVDAPEFTGQLLSTPFGLPLQLVAAAAGIATIVALRRRRYAFARISVIALVSLVVAGWGYAQHPFIIRPELTVVNTAAPAATLRLTAIALAAGSLLLAPSFVALFRIFKGRDA